jgi:FkbM family methyltransferase
MPKIKKQTNQRTMLIPGEVVKRWLDSKGISCKGALHIGAHECEEQSFYKLIGITPEKTLWVEALQRKVDEMKAKGIPHIVQAVVTDKDGETVTFHVTNNVQSSSVLEFGTHEVHHAWVKNVEELTLQTTTIDTLFEQTDKNPANYTFWNLDIQGAELMALRGAQGSLAFAKAVYCEINTEEVYKGCARLPELDAFLESKGFRRVETKLTEFGWGDALYLRI